MASIHYPADSRGGADHGWLKTYHSFSFANYYNPERMNFGVLRVLNDDRVAPGMGFKTHPHKNMEIISIPLEGDLEHKDSMGNVSVIRQGDIQAMSAGTGVEHSEFNRNRDKEVAFLQIWILPKTQNVTPRYDQISINPETTLNQWKNIIHPEGKGDAIWIHQDAWFHWGVFEAGAVIHYELKNPRNGVYLFVLEGALTLEGRALERRDALGVAEVSQIQGKASAKSTLLLMEVLLELPE